MYLWHGWWPNDEDSESRASTTGSAETRWSNDRRLAMETIKSYAQGTVLFFPTTIKVPPPPPAHSPTRLRYYFLLSQIINKKHVSFSPTDASGNLNSLELVWKELMSEPSHSFCKPCGQHFIPTFYTWVSEGKEVQVNPQ